MNLTNFLFGEDQGLSKELASVISDIAIACKSIDHDVSRSGLLNLHGAVGFENVQSTGWNMLKICYAKILKIRYRLFSKNKAVYLTRYEPLTGDAIKNNCNSDGFSAGNRYFYFGSV